MTELTLRLPYPPTGNHAYTVYRGRKALSDVARAYRDLGVMLVRTQAVGRLMRGPCEVLMRAYPPDKRARDGDNLIKLPLDCCVRGGALTDDSNKVVRRITVEWGAPAGEAHLLITIKSIPTQEVL